MDRRDRTKNLVCEILCYSGPALKVHKKEKKAMKYMFASDIHGSAYYCKKMLEAYDKEKADRLVLLGDILYHGPRNDLPKDYAPKEVIALLNERKDDLHVRGNSGTGKVIGRHILRKTGILHGKFFRLYRAGKCADGTGMGEKRGKSQSGDGFL